MQNRYVGDLGDFGKYGLLKSLCLPCQISPGQPLPTSPVWTFAPNRDSLDSCRFGSTIPLWPEESAIPDHPLSLGVVWYLVPDENHNSDGSYIQYLEPSAHNQQRYRVCDPLLYDALQKIVRSERRKISSVRKGHVLPLGTRFYEEELTFGEASGTGPLTRAERVTRRKIWLQDSLTSTYGCDIVFVDPDNGLEVKVGPYEKRGPKYVFYEELLPFLRRNQSLVIYHHIGRRSSALDQIRERQAQIEKQLGHSALAFLYHRGSARAFFIVPAPRHVKDLLFKAQLFMLSPWGRHFDLFGPSSDMEVDDPRTRLTQCDAS